MRTTARGPESAVAPYLPVAVVGRFPPPLDGQTLATERCAALLDRDHHVHRLDTQAPGPDPLSATPRLDLRRGLHYVRLHGHLRRALQTLPRTPVLWHAVSPAPLGHLRDVLTTAPAFREDQPVAAVLHRAGFEALFQTARTAGTARRLVRRLDAVVFQSEALAGRCAAVVPEAKRWVIPNTVRDETVPPPSVVDARRRAGPGGPVRLLFLSNMLPEKGHVDVLDAVAVLTGAGLDVQARFVGGWPSDAARQAFLARARDSGVADRVDVAGPVADAAAVRQYHLGADVFVLPTTHPTETQPIAVLEALAAGTPVVTVERPIMRGVVTDGVEGRLVPPRAPEAIARAVREITEPDVWASTSAAARARFDRTFSPAVVGGRWRALVAEMAARGPAAGRPRRAGAP